MTNGHWALGQGVRQRLESGLNQIRGMREPISLAILEASQHAPVT
jgi:hypothetical protein